MPLANRRGFGSGSAVADRSGTAHDASVEYALLTSAIAVVLVGALGGVGAALPTTASQARATVTRSAQAAGVPAAEARAALAGAPYARQPLRTLYAIGWVAGRRDRSTCVFARVAGSSTAPIARDALRRLRGATTLLRRARVTQQAAVQAIDRGFRASCAA